MVSYLIGNVEEIYSDSILLVTNSGIGFTIFVLSSDKFVKKSLIKLYIFSFNKDNNFLFYGFNKKELFLAFKLLNDVQGIGPKTAMQILKNIDIDRLFLYIANHKRNELSLISGIGKKADRLILELAPKINKITLNNIPYENVYNALLTLGYDANLLGNFFNNVKDNLDEGEVFKQAIRSLKNA